MSDAVFEVIAMIIASALLGGVLVWLRPELDLAPRGTAILCAMVALVPGVVAIVGVVPSEGGILWLFAALAPLAVIDAQRMLLPNEVTLPLIAIGLTGGIAAGLAPGLDRFIGAIVGYGAFWLIGTLWARWQGSDGLGLGDAKLFAAIGSFLGWQALAEVALIGALVTIAIIIILRRRGAPFGPGLALGAMVWWMAGPVLA